MTFSILDVGALGLHTFTFMFTYSFHGMATPLVTRQLNIPCCQQQKGQKRFRSLASMIIQVAQDTFNVKRLAQLLPITWFTCFPRLRRSFLSL